MIDMEKLILDLVETIKENRRMLDESMQLAYGEKWKEEKRRREIEQQQKDCEEINK